MHMGFFSQRLNVPLMAFFWEAPDYLTNYSGVSMANVPEFTGLSTCITTHGIFTPVCRAVQMMSMLNGGNQVLASSATCPIYAMATATSSQIRVLCYSFDENPQANYTTSVNVSINPAGIGSTFNVTQYVLSSTQANSCYLAQQQNLMQANCAQNASLIDSINQSSQLVPVSGGQVSVANGALSLSVSMPAYSAVLFILDKIN